MFCNPWLGNLGKPLLKFKFSKFSLGLFKTNTYSCWVVAKLSWKKHFWKKIFVLFTKYTLFAEKNVNIWKKSFILKNSFTGKKLFFTEKNRSENKKICLIWKICFYTENVCVTNKILIFLKYTFTLQKKFLTLKNIFVKTSLWTQ